MGEEVKVRVENLTKCFGDLRVLDKVSFQIKKESLYVSWVLQAAERQHS